MTEPVFRAAVIVFVTPPVSHYVSMLDISYSVSIYKVVLSLALTLASFLRCDSGVVVCGPLFVVMRH